MISKTVLLQTEIPEGRAVTTHFLMIVYGDDGAEIARAKKPHTITFWPDSDVDALLAANNADIATRGWPEIDATEWARATGHCAAEHTPDVKEAYARFLEAQAELRK